MRKTKCTLFYLLYFLLLCFPSWNNSNNTLYLNFLAVNWTAMFTPTLPCPAENATYLVEPQKSHETRSEVVWRLWATGAFIQLLSLPWGKWTILVLICTHRPSNALFFLRMSLNHGDWFAYYFSKETPPQMFLHLPHSPLTSCMSNKGPDFHLCYNSTDYVGDRGRSRFTLLWICNLIFQIILLSYNLTNISIWVGHILVFACFS